eukprot:6214779-Pleurochrysis_carterae.AAC.3
MAQPQQILHTFDVPFKKERMVAARSGTSTGHEPISYRVICASSHAFLRIREHSHTGSHLAVQELPYFAGGPCD